MVVARSQQPDALALARVGEAPPHFERAADALRERALELLSAMAEPFDAELHAHEERAALGVRGVLVRAEDVRVALEQEPRDRGDDPVPVGTRDEQAGDVPALVGAQGCRAHPCHDDRPRP